MSELTIGKPNNEEALERYRQPRAIVTRTAILDAFAGAFDTIGFAASSMSDVISSNPITKGAVYFHFDTKEAIARQLIEDWDTAIVQAFSLAVEDSEPALTQLRSGFAALARCVEKDQPYRAGMRLTLDPSMGGAHSYRKWIEAVGKLIECAIAEGTLDSRTVVQELAWNLCAGFIGAVQALSLLGGSFVLEDRVVNLVDLNLSQVESRV